MAGERTMGSDGSAMSGDSAALPIKGSGRGTTAGFDRRLRSGRRVLLFVRYSSGSVVNSSGYPAFRPASVARVAFVSATSFGKTATTQVPRRCAVIITR